MSGAPAQSSRQALVAAWLAQMIGTIVLAAIVLYFVLPTAYGILGSFSFFEDIARWTEAVKRSGAKVE